MDSASQKTKVLRSINSKIPLALKQQVPKPVKARLKPLLGLPTAAESGSARARKRPTSEKSKPTAARGASRAKADALWVERLPNAVNRSMDHGDSELTITRLVLEVANAQGVPIWSLPPSPGPRLATTQAPTSAFVEDLHARIEEYNRVSPKRQFAISTRSVAVKNNLYEFDQERFVAPRTADFLSIHPASHGRQDGDYLLDRSVTLEFIIDCDDFLLIPMPGKGPRVYPRGELSRVELDGRNVLTGPTWPFPIDIVYTWVDSNDEIWRDNYASVMHEAELSSDLKAATNASRWHSRDELKFSLRSVEMYAPFVRNIYIVTNGQRPNWLVEHPRVSVVSHETLYPDTSVLPTFNSNHIETVLHRIPGLSEHFLYLNDDFFFARPCVPQDFFALGGIGKLFFSARYVGAGPVLPSDRATVACHKNTRDILEHRFGMDFSQKFQHAPYAMRRSVWNEIETEFAEELVATRSNRFRSAEDINGQFLYAHYAQVAGKSYRSKIGYKYLEVADGHVCDQLTKIEKSGVKVFCLNDSNSDDDGDAGNDLQVMAALNARFPVPAPWERQVEGFDVSSAVSWLSQVDTVERSNLEQEVRVLGVDEAVSAYRAAFELTNSDAVLRKLHRLYLNMGRTDEAVDLIDRSRWNSEQKLIAKINAESSGGRPIEQVARHLHSAPVALQSRLIKAMVRCVNSPDDLAHFVGIVNVSDVGDGRDPVVQQLIARATRRAGLARRAIGNFEQALRQAKYPKAAVKDRRRGAQRMKDPFVVLRDLYDVAGDDRDSFFLDAGTLLGYVREDNFIGHDYDIDLSVRDQGSFERMRDVIETDWRFAVSRVRTPERLIQGKHINGTNIDIFLHLREGDKWVKRSHVYGWRFDDYDVVAAPYRGQEVSIPSPSILYLLQMYGEDWRRPDSAFDSRMFAPNCFFPDRDELICTLLDKALQAVLVGDRTDFETQQRLLESLCDYRTPQKESSVRSLLVGSKYMDAALSSGLPMNGRARNGWSDVQ